MEMMPYTVAHTQESIVTIASDAGAVNWRATVPTLLNQDVRLRELRVSDAPSLLSMLTTEEVVRFISPPPTTIESFRHFIEWSHRQREAGRYVCFGIVPEGYDVAVGIFQLQMSEEPTAEWGFALGSPFWGTGVFVEGAEAMLDFAFQGIGLDRLGARAAVVNGRGNGALRKLGAVREHVIPDGLVRNGRYLDQQYWTICPEDRPQRKVIWDVRSH